MSRSRPLSISLALALLGLLVALPGSSAVDDAALFSTSVPPNVMLLVDNSGSMKHIVWHPAYDPSVANTCSYYTDTSQYFFSSDQKDITRCGNKRTIFVDPGISGSTRFWGHYLNWYFSDAADPYVDDIKDNDDGRYSSCVGGGKYALYKRSRVTAAKDILRQVICEVNQQGSVRFGIAKFRRGGDPNGGYVRVPNENYFDAAGDPVVYTLNGVTQSHGDHLDDAIDELTGEAWTPLSETLFQIYTYFQSRSAADRPLGADLATTFPEYEYTPSWSTGSGGPHSTAGAPTVPDSPVQWPCQRNFVVILTDGEPTKDDYDVNSPTDTAIGYSDFLNLIGDYNPDGEDEYPTCTGCNETTRFLDDIAKFMQENDFRPDLTGDQVIDTYTVGFTTSPFANDILDKTADEGNGLFFFSRDADALATALVDSINDIIRKSQSFTAATVPAQRTAAGSKFYTSVFIPSVKDGFWEGHLRAWTIEADGDVLDSLGNCALEDADPTNCQSGVLKATAVPFWDAGEEVPAPASRNLFASKLIGAGSATRITFDQASIDKDLLGVSGGDIADYVYAAAPPANDEELADMLVEAIRGCELGTGFGIEPCVQRGWLLGDIFHSSPVVVPAPGAFLPELSYHQFALTYATRDRVVMAGANDGFFHLFHAGDWDAVAGEYTAGTGAEIAGFMPYAARQTVKNLPLDSNARDFYYVDGSPTVADVWFHGAPNQSAKLADGSEWRTVSIAGLRQGGRSLFALDVTNPDAVTCTAPASGTGYPCYLWEFPREDADNSIKDYMGETWSEPIVTRIKVAVNGDDNGGYGYERWVAIFGAGYDPESDPNDHASYQDNSKAGRAIFVLDLKTGKILAEKRFIDGAPGPEGEMFYAFASTPGVYDLDFDGFADVVYIGDLGGNMWKWVINPIADDVVNGAGDVTQPQWTFKKFFSAPVYDNGTGATDDDYYKSFFYAPSATLKDQKVWLAFGSGERANLNFPGIAATDLENNRFYAMTDLDPLETKLTPYPTLSEADLSDETGTTTCGAISPNRGFYLRGEDGEKFVSATDIFSYYVFVGSYVPTPAATPCETGGTSYLYAFRIYCGEPLFEDGSGNPLVRIQLGDALPTDPRVTISSDESRVIVNQRDTTHSRNLGINPQGDSGQAYWRELRLED